MKKTLVNDYITLYQFPTEVAGFDFNIVTVHCGEEFVLIDAAYEPQMERLKQELDFSKCKYILFTHHHPDHTFGAKLLENIELIGHKDYRHSFDEACDVFGNDDWTIDGTVPSRFMKDDEKLKFGTHTFTFKHHPLHTVSSMLIDLNGEFVFTGDELLSMADDTDVTSIFFGKNKLEENAYDVLNEFVKGKTIIPGHGNVRNLNLEQFVQKRRLYIKLVIEGVPFNELTNRGFEATLFEDFHNINIELHHNVDDN